MNPQTWWYLSRAGGMVAGVLLVASLVWGVLLATRALKPLDRPAWMLAMHRWFSALAIIGTGLHLVGLVADNYVHFGWTELFVPMGSSWKTWPVTFGVIAFLLLVLVQVTSLIMKRLPRTLWKGIHMSSYGVVWLAMVHAALSGTDATNPVYQAIALLLTIAAVTAAVLRIVLGTTRSRRTAAHASPA